MPDLRWVVAGAPRSGTTWIASVLDHAGLRTGHEHTIRALGDDPDVLHYSNRNLPGESSHLAAAYTAQLRAQGCIIVHLIRAPLDTIGSMLGHRLKLDARNAFGDAIRHFTPQVFEDDNPARQYARYWLAWNELIGHHADLTWRLHEVRAGHVEALASLAGTRTWWTVPFTQVQVPNRGAHPATVGRADIGDALYEQLREAAARYAVPMTVAAHVTDTHDPEGCLLCPAPQVVRVVAAHEPRSHNGQ